MACKMEDLSSELEEYISLLSSNIDMVDDLPDEVVDKLIVYLEKEVNLKEAILKKLKNENQDE